MRLWSTGMIACVILNKVETKNIPTGVAVSSSLQRSSDRKNPPRCYVMLGLLGPLILLN